MASDSQGHFTSHLFEFDQVFDPNASQKEVYDVAARPIIDSVLEGFNGAIFAYGQTSSGKTYTMQGDDIDDVESQGIIPRMVRTVFNRIQSANENMEFSLKVSMCEIYNENIQDLLNPTRKNLKVFEEKAKGVYIKDITESWCIDEDQVYKLMRYGNKNRACASTSMNAQSSRSHALFILTILITNTEDGSSKSGKLYLVDLAGSERVSKSGATGQVLEEAKSIN